jgi:hypothetical protein
LFARRAADVILVGKGDGTVDEHRGQIR